MIRDRGRISVGSLALPAALGMVAIAVFYAGSYLLVTDRPSEDDIKFRAAWQVRIYYPAVLLECRLRNKDLIFVFPGDGTSFAIEMWDVKVAYQPAPVEVPRFPLRDGSKTEQMADRSFGTVHGVWTRESDVSPPNNFPPAPSPPSE